MKKLSLERVAALILRSETTNVIRPYQGAPYIEWKPVFLLRIGFVFFLLLFAGCATAYRPANVTGGYTDFPQEDTTYRVRFKGNNYTSREKVEQFLLYRCAELTTQLGYDHFLLLSQDTLDISDPLAKAGIFPRNYYATALIRVVRQSEHTATYDAREVIRRLQAQYPKELGS